VEEISRHGLMELCKEKKPENNEAEQEETFAIRQNQWHMQEITKLQQIPVAFIQILLDITCPSAIITSLKP
jgi:hypothetical protein